MKKMIVLFSVIVSTCLTYGIDNARLLRSPDVSGESIVFVYAGNLWKTPLAGGNSVQLTTHPGSEGNPTFSPDGKWIAFSGSYDGNTDVYVIPSQGGVPKRLTYHPSYDIPTGWSPDGKSVLFNSGRENFSRISRLYTIDMDGVFPEALPLPKAVEGSYSPDGKKLAYCPLSSNVFRSWRRYRGGTAPYIWIYDTTTHKVKDIPRTDSNDYSPHWIKNTIVFLSDRDRVMNLYSYNTQTDTVTPLTEFKGSDIKSMGADDNHVVFERDGLLHLMNLSTKHIDTLAINIPDERINNRPSYINASGHIHEADISPSGKRAVFSARGDILTVPAEHGDIRNLSRTPCKMERSGTWSPDGANIAYFGEHEDEYTIKIVDQKGEKDPVIFNIDNPTFFYSLVWSPDSKNLAFNDVKQNLYFLNIKSGKIVKVDTDPLFLHYPFPQWSPDSKWLTYSRSVDNEMSAVFLYSLKDGNTFQVTDGMSHVTEPVFDKNGKYLYFKASTDMAQDMAWLDMSQHPHTPTQSLYAMVLSASETSPFSPKSDEEEVKKEKKAADKKTDNKEKDTTKEKKEESIVIDIAGLQNRIVAFDTDRGRYNNLIASENRLFYQKYSTGDRNWTLFSYDIKKKKEKKLSDKIATYTVSADGKKILYRSGRSWFISDSSAIKPGKGRLKLSQMETYRVPKYEYRQILHEAWRINRDFFYDPGMHGQDWDAVWKQYEAYLPYVSHRSDLTYLIYQMIGEYTCGHAYAGGGETPTIDYVPGGLLGADYTIENGRYRISKIYRGESWNPDLRSPLTEPGITINQGDYIISVNGINLTDTRNIYKLLVKTSGKQVTLTVSSDPSGSNSRTFTVVPVSNEYTLRHRQWIEENRQTVEKLSDGKVGYVYMPNTSSAGFDYFNRYFFASMDKDAIVIDERFNGGGYVADYVINVLNQPLLNWWQPRYGKPFKSSNAGHYGPKAMLINEHAGSGGDYMPWAFRETGLGKLIGKRTWGGLVGISGYPTLMDGGYITAPSFGFVNNNGEFRIENEGVAPDIDVDIYPEDAINGKDPQLIKAVEVLIEELKEKQPSVFKHNGFPRGR